MSEPKRFDCLSDGMWQNSAGDYVLHSDYARLKAEVERLRNIGIKLDGYVDLLQGENERLRKAGDAVSICLEAYWKGKPYDVSMTIQCFDAWNAAKEGKQP